MKKIILSSLLILSVNIYSQELDQAYLNSLPEDIRADVEERIEAEEILEKPVYRRASTFIDKEEDTSSRFGSNFFDVMQTSFMPINEPNLDPSYILDFGDVLEIQLIGQKNIINSYSIKRDGSINLPDIGKLILSGLSLSDASQLIKARVNNAYIGTEAYVSLKNIRDINVLVVGNAYNPGIYTLNGNSNMLHALSMAGGIDNLGSYRNINLVRSGKVIDTLDIYEVLVDGKYNFSNGLRSGDSIVVKPYSKLISIESGAMRTGIYELNDDESFKDLLRFANGFSKQNDYEQITIKRVSNGSNQELKLSLDELYSYNFIDNDSLYIRQFKLNNISILGAVKNPGKYTFTKGTTLSEAIISAGGYESSAYVFGGYLENSNALQINIGAKEKLYEAFITNLITNSSTIEYEKSGVDSLILQLKNTKPTGRIIAEFDIDLIKNDPSLDTLLENGDRLIIPYKTQQVYIHGQIANPGAIRYSPGMDIDYYINKSGGTIESADLDNLFIIHPNGETENLNTRSKLSFILADNNKKLIYPGSIIYIPQDTNFSNPLQVASIWAPIISSIALSLTSLSVLNNTN